jgi:hypothetical protein
LLLLLLLLVLLQGRCTLGHSRRCSASYRLASSHRITAAAAGCVTTFAAVANTTSLNFLCAASASAAAAVPNVQWQAGL